MPGMILRRLCETMTGQEWNGLTEFDFGQLEREMFELLRTALAESGADFGLVDLTGPIR